MNQQLIDPEEFSQSFLVLGFGAETDRRYKTVREEEKRWEKKKKDDKDVKKGKVWKEGMVKQMRE